MEQGIIIYKEYRQHYGTVGFLSDIKNQIQIKNIDSESIFKNQLIKLILSAKKLASIKTPIQDIVIVDIKEMIIEIFKHLSFDEMAYAFKLERQLDYDEVTKHYNNFNTQYVATILKKYEEWKAEKRKQHNLNHTALTISEKPSKDEINHIMTEAIKDGKILYLETGKIELGSSRYDWLDGQGLFLEKFNITQEQFKDIKNRRYNIVKNELQEAYKAKKNISYADKQKTKDALKSLLKDKSSEVVVECKRSLLKDYYKS